jgi:hypothetical protein
MRREGLFDVVDQAAAPFDEQITHFEERARLRWQAVKWRDFRRYFKNRIVFRHSVVVSDDFSD